jgi:hypothetical protein
VSIAGPPGNQALAFDAPFPSHAQSVDQRVKMAGWLELLEERGGKVRYIGATTADLEGLTALYDLTIVAAGKGDLVQLFDRDAERSAFSAPQRNLACVYLDGVLPRERTQVGINVAPGAGELFVIPALTTGPDGTTRPCEIAFWETVPGGPLDRFDNGMKPQEFLDQLLALAREYMPWEYERLQHAEPTDSLSTLAGAVTPTVRRPVGRLSNDALVLGMGDAVVVNDPIAGQGSNNAAQCAKIYFDAITAHGDAPFDEAWMTATFEAYWAYAAHSTGFSNMLLGPLPDHVQMVLGAAASTPAVAARFAAGYGDPADFQNWITTPEAAQSYLSSVGAA